MTNLVLWAAGLVFASYLLGSLSSAVIVSKFWGLADPRTQGSNNPGATNMLRLGGKVPALLTFLGDGIKGFIPVYFSQIILSQFFPFIEINTSSLIISGIFLTVVLGHLYPIFFQFKGGKGVATALGGLFGLSLYLGLSFVGIWLSVAIVTRYSSLAALSAIALVLILAYFGMAPNYWIVIGLVALLLFWRHRSNIHALINGTEGKIGR